MTTQQTQNICIRFVHRRPASSTLVQQCTNRSTIAGTEPQVRWLQSIFKNTTENPPQHWNWFVSTFCVCWDCTSTRLDLYGPVWTGWWFRLMLAWTHISYYIRMILSAWSVLCYDRKIFLSHFSVVNGHQSILFLRIRIIRARYKLFIYSRKKLFFSPELYSYDMRRDRASINDNSNRSTLYHIHPLQKTPSCSAIITQWGKSSFSCTLMAYLVSRPQVKSTPSRERPHTPTRSNQITLEGGGPRWGYRN